jgi:hypothetical protein
MDGHACARKLREDAEKVKYNEPIHKRKQQNMRDSLNECIVDELQRIISDEVYKNCYGCQVDHPSQMQHVLCLFTSRDEWVELYIEKALSQLNLYNVMEKWYPKLELMDVHGSEKIQALHMWVDIREKLARHQ